MIRPVHALRFALSQIRPRAGGAGTFHAAALCCGLFTAALPGAAQAQSHCIALAQDTPGVEYVHKASFGTPLPDHTVRINYVAHATFVLETPAGVTAATDYTGFLGATAFLPDIVTMNIAHSSHFTRNPDPAIPHVLPGWGLGETPAQHNLRVEDVLVRNVPTDIRSAWQDGRRDNGNSIFIFEVAGLCIGHLGHLHHEPSEAQYAAIGRLDVVMAPVDGGYTLDRATMVRVLTRLRSSLILPMHWFGQSNLDAFLADMEAHFTVVDRGDSAIEVSLRSLPATPTVWLLRPRYLHDDR
ncbi:MAG TPA: Zn-dependent hydrolase [Rhodobacteraceae bacterium]|jgi:L-ascorbate metabolism protein UlaG (beta-lactamase superfamily)|nr:MBL fold metallo-hydrolase [Paracoccaceae bacterium]HBG97832.1 Zn-dependent hydrolase [Paracoccaceae bacterium]